MREARADKEAPPRNVTHHPRGGDFHLATSGDHNLAIDTLPAFQFAAQSRSSDGCPTSMWRLNVDNITGARRADTRRRCIDKAIALFREGNQR